MKKKISLFLELVIVILLVLLDQLTKRWAVVSLKGTDGIDLISGVLKFYYLPNGNTGAAFGVFKGQLWLFIMITILVVGALSYLLVKIPNSKRFLLLQLVLVFIIAGGIGNMIDRCTNQYVVDFIYFYLIDFPIFNVADCFVTVATVTLAILLLFVYKEKDFSELEEMILPFKNRKQD